MQTEQKQIKVEIHRFKFTDETMSELKDFAKIHQYDDRQTFKEAWIDHIQNPNIKSLFDEESNRLFHSGYRGDVYEKMYKSIRYYFKKKINRPHLENPIERKQYESRDTNILREMDDHIREQIKKTAKSENQQIICSITPADSFENYCERYKNTTILNEIQKNSETIITTNEVNKIIKALKKTYKNRFYNITNSLR
jgi:hypothetical protein